MSEQTIYSVTQLNREVRQLLHGNFPRILVEAEISNLVRPASGHIYFTLKDDKAQVRCAMFKGNLNKIRFQPTNGMQVLVRANISLYEPRGDYQLIAEHMEEAGLGALQRQFEELKKKLDKEGLFAEKHKQELPEYPKRLGVVTSSTGAAIRDILHVCERRFPLLPIILYPTLVQGDKAAAEIAQAIETANERKECDVLIVGRGGGSLEDLWPFNEEIVARAIYKSEIPIVSAVGHEIDFTIADFVADVRAPTPSAAAEIVCPDIDELYEQLAGIFYNLKQIINFKLQQFKQNVDLLSKQIIHPGEKIKIAMQRNQDLMLRLQQAQRHILKHHLQQLQKLSLQVHHATPHKRIEMLKLQIIQLQQNLVQRFQQAFNDKRQKFLLTSQSLEQLNPLATLNRGYAIALNQQQVVNSVKQIKSKDKLTVKVSDGEFECEVL